jgi:hypothetical protein
MASDELVAEILESFELLSLGHAARKRRLGDLRRALTADYMGSVQRMARAGDLPLRDLSRRAGELLPGFNVTPLHFEEAVARFTDPSAGPRATVRMSGHGRSGHPLRGFYYRSEEAPALIWVNLRHVLTAVAASFAHELGHWFWDDLNARTASGPYPFYNAGFAEHLDDPRELFADCFTTIAAYPRDLARLFFSPRGWPRVPALRQQERATVADVYDYLRREYGADLGPKSGLAPPSRLYYVTSMIHFARLRAAVLKVTGL